MSKEYNGFTNKQTYQAAIYFANTLEAYTRCKGRSAKVFKGYAIECTDLNVLEVNWQEVATHISE